MVSTRGEEEKGTKVVVKRGDCEVRWSFSFELESAKPDLVDMPYGKGFWVILVLLRGYPYKKSHNEHIDSQNGHGDSHPKKRCIY
ncbi:hypothetical protein TorRG33x02_209680 [Trema orientale]|uniref:Uncharacterized protein n=1 Tax=Trema orientale TaxID=63057 RepID=A0A2P5ECM5_TREOI|nr:hypothetical protein TorRG33x02_209680 [Trema orientale]